MEIETDRTGVSESVLSRRALLKGVGIGAGALALGGFASACSRGGAAGGTATATPTAAGTVSASPTPMAGGTLDVIKERGYVIAGLFDERPPAFLDDDRNLTGIFPTIARRIFEEELGIAEVQPVVTQWQSLIPGLQAQRYDLVIAGMFITPERCQEVLFTKPFRCSPEGFLMREGETFGLQEGDGYDELVAIQDQVRIATVPGSTAETNLTDAGIPQSDIQFYNTLQELLTAIQQGRADVADVSFASAKETLALPGVDAEGTVLYAFTPTVNGEPRLGCGGFAFRQEDSEMRALFDEKINAWLGADEMYPMVEQWMSREELEIAVDVTANQLCGA